METNGVLDSFDAQAILAAVDAGEAPDDWHVYRTRRGYFLAMGIFNIVFASLMGSMSVLMVVILFISLHSSIDQTDLTTCMFPFFGIFLALLSVYFIRQGLKSLAQRSSAKEQVLVLTPRGVVGRVGPQISSLPTELPSWSWNGMRGGRIFTVPYEKVATVGLNVTSRGRYSADVGLKFTLNGLRWTFPADWSVDDRFPDHEGIAQQIIEAHARYMAQHAQAQ